MSAPPPIPPAARWVARALLGAAGVLEAAGRLLRQRVELSVIRRSRAFDADWYLETNPDLRVGGVDPARHFRDHGAAEGRDPGPDFPFASVAAAAAARGARGNSFVWHELHERPRHGATAQEAIAATRASPFFDPVWYLATYNDIARVGMDPAAHYARYGWREGRNPGPGFNTRFYLDQLPDEERATAFPLAHYAAEGTKRGFTPAPLPQPVAPALPTGPLRAPCALDGRFSVGVMLHVFYVDMAPALRAALERVPVRFALHVSTDTAEKAEALERAFAGTPMAERTVVRVVPNRGRDVAPMLVAFREELLACDLVLHLHSKRSPYNTGLEGWFEHCVAHLADSPLYVDMVLRAFDADPKLGVFAAPVFPVVARWMTWAGMRGQAERLLGRLGLPAETLDAFPLDFPASTMMWFRPAALRQLFEAGLDWEDFPEEAGQIHGTTAHVVERLVYYVARANGFGWRTGRPALDCDAFALRLLPPPEAPTPLPVCDPPTVSIIVPVFNQWAETAACLRAIVEHTESDRVAYEVILADDASTDDTRRAEEAFPGLRVVRGEENVGFLENVNRAAAVAQGAWLMLLNNDTQPQPGWLEALLEGFRLRPGAAVVGAKLVYPDGTLQEAGGIVWRDASGANYGRNDAAPGRAEYVYVRETDYVSGAAILVDAAFWRARGGFDLRFRPAYYEDTDLCFAARADGRSVILHPGALVAHFEGKSHGTDIGSGVKRHQAINRGTFAEKWRETLARDHLDPPDLWIARDRAQGRKVVAVIDWEAPEYDRHAGGRYVWDYLRLLVEDGCAVKFLACHLGDGRQLAVAAELRRMGVEVHLPPRLHEIWSWADWIADHARWLDAAILSRPNVAEAHLHACRAAGVPTIYLCHDLHFLRQRREAETTGSAAGMALADAMETQERRLFGEADFAFTPSEVERGIVAERFGTEAVGVLPVCVVRETTPRREPPPGAEAIFVGGMAHGPNPHGMAWFLDAVWPQVRGARPDARLHVVGRGAPDDLLARAAEDDSVIFHGGVSEAALAARYASARAAIAPLRFGAGVKGKVVEALRHGVPVVGTPVALEGVPGLAAVAAEASDARSFALRLVETLSLDDAAWRAASTAGAAFVLERFGPETCRTRLREGLSAASENRRLRRADVG